MAWNEYMRQYFQETQNFVSEFIENSEKCFRAIIEESLKKYVLFEEMCSGHASMTI